ncbi:MAG: tRNA (N6-isopentenyl adenosine(37)-C2)-methylthiotransferase MiaB [Deltaproteobacteria bacterium]|nr:tRNA (N6-isopentenyl adenosine(37)-C2)-methylthiotransferase MiaB [Deltaproteobacteria bacterium]
MGCQMNEYDSDYLGQVLVSSNYLPTDNPKQADVILINTCTVRAKAAQKALSLLGRMVPLKKRNPELILGITGCLAQQEGSSLMQRFPDLDLVLGTREKERFESFLKRISTSREKIVAIDMDGPLVSPLPNNGYFKGRVKSFISVMEGCNNFCSYCIVPYVRGREVSRPPKEILEEIRHLVSQGTREITLLGQNVNSYKWDKTYGFSSLLKEVNKIEDLARIRFTTSHPKDLSDDLINIFAELDNLCPHIHLPFQSGSNKILRLMNRRYSRERYIDLIGRLRQVRPEIAITSDVMVGFPKESDEDFQMTLDLIKKIEFDNLYSFKYSDRKGTSAEKMEGKVDDSKKSSRLETLQRLQKDITLGKNRMLEGTRMEVLVEGYGKRNGQLTGRTASNKVVNFSCNNNVIGNLIDVKIQHAAVNSLQGILTNMNH